MKDIERVKKSYYNDRVSISNDNAKMGKLIGSLSFAPARTCAENVPCKNSCYACSMCNRCESVLISYLRNERIYRENPVSFWNQLRFEIQFYKYFRFFVSGDLVDYEMLKGVVSIACEVDTKILMFTKKYDLVNRYVEEFKFLPENLKIIFSYWGNFGKDQNKYNFPASNIIFKNQDTSNLDIDYLCNGNCSECICCGLGCWNLPNGQTVYFNQHSNTTKKVTQTMLKKIDSITAL